MVYVNNSGRTQLTTSQSTFDQHVALDQADPKYITIATSTPYRYYAFKFADNRGGAYVYMAVRRIELQTTDSSYYRRTVPLLDVDALTNGRIPYASLGGRLIDSANLLFNGTTLTTSGLSATNGMTTNLTATNLTTTTVSAHTVTTSLTTPKII